MIWASKLFEDLSGRLFNREWASVEEAPSDGPTVAPATSVAGKPSRGSRLREGGPRFLSVAAVLALPEPEWLVDGTIPKNAVGQLYGPSGGMKSFVALDIAMSVASGKNWMGRAVAQGPVVYVAGEGVSGYKKRMIASLKYHGFGPGDLPDFRLADDAVQLREEPTLDHFIERVEAEFTSRSLALIVFDTQARCTVGIEENSNTEMGRVVQALDKIRRSTGATVLLVHHTGKKGGDDRGASAVKGAVSFQIRQTKSSKLRVELICTKQKDWDEFKAFSLDLLAVADSLVPVPMGQGSAVGIGYVKEALNGNERVAFDALAPHPLGLKSGAWKGASGLGKGSFQKVRNSLVEKGLVSRTNKVYRVSTPNTPDSPTTKACSEEVHWSTPPLGGGLVDSEASDSPQDQDQAMESAWEDMNCHGPSAQATAGVVMAEDESHG